MTATPTDEVTPQSADAVTTAPEAVAKIAHEFAQAIHSEGNIRVVFGSPMALDNHKIIPVAQVEIGFGGGLGMGRAGNGLTKHLGSLADMVRRGFGAGGGAGIKVVPLGFIHETGDRVQYQAIASSGKRPIRMRNF